jgi:hypothetical protein
MLLPQLMALPLALPLQATHGSVMPVLLLLMATAL